MENEYAYPPPMHPAVRAGARFVSYVFHPVFLPIYVIAYLIFIHPYSYASLQEKQKLMKLVSFFILTVFFPTLTVFLLWRLKFVESIKLRTQQERIIPYIASIIYFFWAWYVSKNQTENPLILVSFLLGLFLTTSAALMANSYFKISMHALGVGGVLAFMVLIGLYTFDPMGVPISIATIIAGLVCTARLAVSDHHPVEIIWGFLIGILFQVIACVIVL
ncbi:hypothetical protein EXU57_23530 [Segetibacter sp. 3557_3]|uniref:hypothetical protein n=1 Tax=Segetibacter sp. 3557_3 TaxID=2547429 RepID=UPI0010586FA5|nr:hypothetical protein [Segetibacter sp. 3557_3]TDH18332.1 hypothetical protein EXU57_23530 [Segetibacter sp. 3557_3]